MNDMTEAEKALDMLLQACQSAHMPARNHMACQEAFELVKKELSKVVKDQEKAGTIVKKSD